MTTLTEKIFELTAPWDNPYQGKDKKIVFVCSAGILRSATAARLYGDKYNTRAAGSSSYALVPLSVNLITWADEIVFVNPYNHQEALEVFDDPDIHRHVKVMNKLKAAKVLNIPDEYEHMHPELIKAFEEQYEGLE